MAEEHLQLFLEKIRQLNSFVALSESDPEVRRALRDCSHHQQVVGLARSHGFEIGRRWGEQEALGTEGNSLLAGPCPAEGEESTTILLQTPALRLERIHSCSAASAPGFWYKQREHEWVLLLQGSARLRFDHGAGDLVELNRGDALTITAGRPHRVELTDPAPGTIWLALFWPD
jgi:cupin 2 domain-containing protein